MSLIAFHKFLITTAIVFCLGFALRQLSEFRATGDGWTLLAAAAFGIAGLALGFYLRHLRNFLKIPTENTASHSVLRSDPKGFVATYLRPAEPLAGEALEGSGDGRGKWVRWATTLVGPHLPPWKKNGHKE